MESDTRCGVIALIGPTNAGKSTLLNALVGPKISITAPKAHTTRQRIVGILTQGDTQFIFVDTPGMGSGPFARSMDPIRHRAVLEANVTVCVVDAARPPDPATLQRIHIPCPLYLAMNKVDTIRRHELLARIAPFSHLENVRKFYMISALRKEGIEDMLAHWREVLPAAPWRFDAQEVTTLPLKLWACDITREQIIHLYNQEIPYDVEIKTAAWIPQSNGSVKVYQNIHVRRDGQKAIILGTKGVALQRLSRRARLALQNHLQQKIHLFLHVKKDK